MSCCSRVDVLVVVAEVHAGTMCLLVSTTVMTASIISIEGNCYVCFSYSCYVDIWHCEFVTLL